MSEESTQSPILISEIHLQNLLSFGPDAKPIPLGPLNVLIGPNGSGKSNLIEAIELIRATPTTNLRDVISKAGGIIELYWKGERSIDNHDESHFFESTAFVRCWFPQKGGDTLIHGIGITAKGNYWEVRREKVELGSGYQNFMFVRSVEAGSFLQPKRYETAFLPTMFHSDQSVLAQLRDQKQFPEFYFLQESYPKIKIYREFEFGRNSSLRQLQRADIHDDSLEEDFSNLAVFLKHILAITPTKEAFLESLTELYEGLTDIQFHELGDWIEIQLCEGELKFPVSRISDGTVHYLCLLAILLDPTPPPLICIEEPELGMHPDIIVKIAELLVDASSRTQLIVNTHSDIILDYLSTRPESVLVCEKHNGSTEIVRLDPESLKAYLEHRSLGDMWNSNIIGGRRW
jgi:predicted ATPase